MPHAPIRLFATLSLASLLAACAPEVGSERWCTQLAEKPKGDWTANEAKDYAKHCLFRQDDKGE